MLSLQYYNHESYCHDFVSGEQEKVYHILVTNDDSSSIEKVLGHLKHSEHKHYQKYPEEFQVSTCVDYSTKKCQLYTSLYKLSLHP